MSAQFKGPITFQHLRAIFGDERGSIAPPPEAPPVAPPTPPPESIPEWRASLPDDLKADPSLATFKDVPSLAKSYVETKKLVGAKAFKVPDATATDEERATFRKTLGVPDTPDGYQIKRPEIAVDSMVWDQNAEKNFLARMHRAGAPPEVVQEAISFYGEFFAAQMEAARREAQAVQSELRREWGPTYDAHVGRANRAVQEYGGEELVNFLATSGLGRHPLMVKAWAKVGDALVEHGAMRAAGVETLTKDEATERIATLRAELAKTPEGGPRSKELIDQIIALTRQVGG